MKILDLFCGEGIAARGLMKYGDVTGIDNDLTCEKHYPGNFILGTWESALAATDLDDFDFIWASPPCHNYSMSTRPARAHGKKYPDLLRHVIEELHKTGKPFVVENVAQAPFQQSFQLCGQMFGKNLKRHRRFYANFFVMCPPPIQNIPSE